MRIALAAILTSLALASGQPASAAVIDFDAFPIAPLGAGTEDGFTLAGGGSNLVLPAFQGFPTKSLAASAPFANVTLEITRSLSFVFDELKFMAPVSSPQLGPITVTGYSGATLMATDTFAAPFQQFSPSTYAAINLAGIGIDRLVLTFASTAGSQLVDDIVLSEVPTPAPTPEPASAALLLAGIALLAAKRRA